MTHKPAESKRQGLTLIEVLVAIFIMGIGTIAILTLFPLGVLRMADAIKDERSSNAVANAKAIATILDIRHDSAIQNAFFDPEEFVPANQKLPMLPPDPNGPSYPVFVDPIGFRSSLPPTDTWLGGVQGTIARRSPGFVGNDQTALRFFTFLDDLTFNKVGRPASQPGGLIERDIRYSWAYICQLPRSADRSVVELTVVVYNQRSTFVDDQQGAGGKVNLTLPEFVYDNSVFDLNERTVELNHAVLEDSPVKPGTWILDATQVRDSNGKNVQSTHANFYRVTEVESGGSGKTKVSIGTDFQGFTFSNRYSRIQKDPNQPLGPNNVLYVGRIIVLEGVSEVFELGAGRLP